MLYSINSNDLDDLQHQGLSEADPQFLGIGKNAKAKRELRNDGYSRKEARQIVKGKIAPTPTSQETMDQPQEAVAQGTADLSKMKSAPPAGGTPGAAPGEKKPETTPEKSMKKPLLIGGGILLAAVIGYFVFKK